MFSILNAYCPSVYPNGGSPESKRKSRIADIATAVIFGIIALIALFSGSIGFGITLALLAGFETLTPFVVNRLKREHIES